MKTNFICKAFLLTAALFTTSFAKEEDYVVKKNEFSNTATFIGGPVDGIVEGKSSKCEVDIKDLKQYAVVSEKVFGMDDICKDNYVVALSSNPEDNAEYKMIKARIVESSVNCNDAQVILNKETYDKISKDEISADIIWAVVDAEGNIKLKVNYDGFDNFNDYVGIPAEELEKIFEESAKQMVSKGVDAQGYPWDVTEVEGHGKVFAAATVAAVAGLICFAGYKVKSTRSDTESSLAIPDLPPLDTTINTVSDHPEGLPRVDIYNPPLEFYHFPMDTSYDIVDIRPDFYE